MARPIAVKRAYDPPAPDDGVRVLVDRLWPRGLTKEKAAVDAWMRDIAPSTELRQWFHRDRTQWAEFERRYRRELDTPEKGALLTQLKSLSRKGKLTLLYGAKERDRNHATILAEVLSG
ncbi:MAG: DUF488 family protein [Hyphomicrobiales bacterium]